MTRITTALACRIAAALIRRSWALQSAAERHQARGERMEAWAHLLAERWGCVDVVLSTLTEDALRA